MHESCTDVKRMEIPTARVCDGDEDAKSIERDSWGKSNEVINAKFLVVPVGHKPAFVFL